MKTKKVVVGTLTAAILSLNVGALPVSYAAGETVQISVGTAQANPGDTVTVDVSLSKIPSAGIQGCDFAIEYDKSVLTVTDVKAGALTNTGADSADSTSSAIPLFNSEIASGEGVVDLAWSTSLDSSQYWLKDGGVFCTLTVKVAANAANGDYPLEVTAIDRETYPNSGVKNTTINAGYNGASGAVKYNTTVTNGKVTVGQKATETPTQGNVSATLRGDANCDKKVDINDAVLIMSYVANKSKYPISDQGMANGDVYQTGDGIGLNDSVQIQKYLAKMITVL